MCYMDINVCKGVARGGSTDSHQPPFAIVCCAHALIADDAGSDERTCRAS